MKGSNTHAAVITLTMLTALLAHDIRAESDSASGTHQAAQQLTTPADTVAEYLILGAVNSIGYKPWHEGVDLVRAISKAGGFTPNAMPHSVTIFRANEEGDYSPISLNLNLLLTVADLKQNPPILPGDIVSVPSTDTIVGTITVLGAVDAPGIRKLTAGGPRTLAQIILSIDLKDDASLRRVRLRRPNNDGTTETQVVDVRDLLSTGHLEKDVPLMNGDIVVIGQRGLEFE